MNDEKDRTIRKLKRIKRRLKKPEDDQGRIRKIRRAIRKLRDDQTLLSG